ncbi:MAG TPA: hypothetical protein VN689_07285, partial [Burkholderiales bacterium]|nr:hypothetical protein [Burkholderiales bacterium]
VGGDTAVVQLRDMWMHEAGKDVTLAQKARARFSTAEFGAHEFQRNALDEIAGVAFGKVHATHTAFADQAQQAIGTYALADANTDCIVTAHSAQRAGSAVIENSLRAALCGEQCAHFAQQAFVITALTGQPRVARIIRLQLRLSE